MARLQACIAGILATAAVAVAAMAGYEIIVHKPYRDAVRALATTKDAADYNEVLSEFAAGQHFSTYFSGLNADFYHHFHVPTATSHQRYFVAPQRIHPGGSGEPDARRPRCSHAINNKGVALEGILQHTRTQFLNKSRKF